MRVHGSRGRLIVVGLVCRREAEGKCTISLFKFLSDVRKLIPVFFLQTETCRQHDTRPSF